MYKRQLRIRLSDLGLPKNITLENLQSYVNSIISQISSIQGEKENVRSEIKRTTQHISNLIKESKCPLCLQNLPSDYKDRLMKQFYQEISDYRQQLTELENNIRELELLRNTLFTVFSSLQAIHSERGEIIRQMENEKKLLKEALQELNEKERDVEVLKKELIDLESKIAEFDYSMLEDAQKSYEEALEGYSNLKYRVQNLEEQKKEIMLRLENLEEQLNVAQKKLKRLEKVKKTLDFIEEIRQAYRSIQPKIRGDFVSYLERIVQQILDDLAGSEGPSFTIRVDENYTPIINGEEGYERSALNLSGGERTFLAFAYRLGIGQLIMHIRSGHGLSLLLLDEPTESLGREDGSIDRLAEILSLSLIHI